MEIKQFIEKAIEGGWNPYGLNRTQEGIKDSVRFCESVVLHKMLLDPEAWKAVGKVEGWKTTCGQKPENCLVPHLCERWYTNMHGMIEALAEGKTIEQYLETL